ncbi:MAG: GNAT family N-acetyltransferase [Proteobacteria bacterium]|nr:GNAT family N-acetyltransferase [Pseudomonadota bacterium]
MDGEAIEIGRLAAADRADWEVLWHENLRHFRAPDVAFADLPVIWQRLLDPAEPLLGWLVRVEGRPAGLAHVVLRQHTFSARPVAILEDLWIAPFARRRGLGERLIAHLAEGGRAAGWRRIEWETEAHNHAAQRLYDRIAAPDAARRYRLALG